MVFSHWGDFWNLESWMKRFFLLVGFGAILDKDRPKIRKCMLCEITGWDV